MEDGGCVLKLLSTGVPAFILSNRRSEIPAMPINAIFAVVYLERSQGSLPTTARVVEEAPGWFK